MNYPNDVVANDTSPSPADQSHRPNRRLFVAIGLLVLVFIKPLYDLCRFALAHDLYSHIVLIPFVSLYLIWIKRAQLPAPSAPNRKLATGLLIAGILLAGCGLVALDGALPPENLLAVRTLAFVSLLVGVCAWFEGARTIRALTFPLGFLVFMIPMPAALRDTVEAMLQHSSAVAAAALFKIYGTPFFRDDTYFQLPGMNLQVAPECSGIHSSLALFITSFVAGYLFLRSPWLRVVLAVAVLPLAIIRNGFRVFVIGELCVHISPAMIDSYIHRHGGPIFFALSLVPFFLFLLLLLKIDRPKTRTTLPAPAVP